MAIRIGSRSFALALATGFFVVAAAAALMSDDARRAVTASRALNVADAAGADGRGDDARAAALARTDGALGRGGYSGARDELVARRALESVPPDLDAAEAAARAALRHSPARATAWARLAEIDARRDSRLDAPGRDALALSYAAAPYAPEAFRRRRLALALAHWAELDEATRDAALADAQAAAPAPP